MPYPLFEPPRAPSERSTTNRQPAVLTTPFGDGYRQRTPAGLNADLVKATLVWVGLSKADAVAIETFFAARRGVEAFRWTAPWEDVERLWLATKWGRGFDKPTATFQADVEEVPA